MENQTLKKWKEFKSLVETVAGQMINKTNYLKFRDQLFKIAPLIPKAKILTEKDGGYIATKLGGYAKKIGTQIKNDKNLRDLLTAAHQKAYSKAKSLKGKLVGGETVRNARQSVRGWFSSHNSRFKVKKAKKQYFKGPKGGVYYLKNGKKIYQKLTLKTY